MPAFYLEKKSAFLKTLSTASCMMAVWRSETDFKMLWRGEIMGAHELSFRHGMEGEIGPFSCVLLNYFSFITSG